MDESKLDEALFPWHTKPNAESPDHRRCAFFYDNTLREDYCVIKRNYICKIGDYECAPKGMSTVAVHEKVCR